MINVNYKVNYERYLFWSLEFLRICEGSGEFRENLFFVSVNLTVPWGYLPGSATTNLLSAGHAGIRGLKNESNSFFSILQIPPCPADGQQPVQQEMQQQMRHLQGTVRS